MSKTTEIPEPAQGYPSLSKVQTMVKAARSKYGRKNALAAVRAFVSRLCYDMSGPRNKAFVFGFPYVGDGEDDDPFYLGITSISILTAAVEIASSGTSIFHADATFKLSDLGYPVVTCGVTNRSRSYQLAAMFIVSRRTAIDYTQCLRSLIRQIQQLCSARLKVDAIMGDAEDAQHNAFLEVQDFADKSYLMCFFHVLYNVRRRTRHMHVKLARIAMTSIFDMHYAKDASSFLAIRDEELRKWKTTPGLDGFTKYFYKQWLTGRYWRWQIYHTPPGFATTNNPCETFNAALKKFVGRRRYNMQELIKQLLDMTESRTPLQPSSSDFAVVPTKPIKDAAKHLIANKLVVVTQSSSSRRVIVQHVDTLQGIQRDEEASYYSTFSDDASPELGGTEAQADSSVGCLREAPLDYTDWEGEIVGDDAKRAGAQLYWKAVEWSMRRALRAGMPLNGWTVDLAKPCCECGYFFKFAMCAHIVIARSFTGAGPERMLASKIIRQATPKTKKNTRRENVVQQSVQSAALFSSDHLPVESSQPFQQELLSCSSRSLQIEQPHALCFAEVRCLEPPPSDYGTWHGASSSPILRQLTTLDNHAVQSTARNLTPHPIPPSRTVAINSSTCVVLNALGLRPKLASETMSVGLVCLLNLLTGSWFRFEHQEYGVFLTAAIRQQHCRSLVFLLLGTFNPYDSISSSGKYTIGYQLELNTRLVRVVDDGYTQLLHSLLHDFRERCCTTAVHAGRHLT